MKLKIEWSHDMSNCETCGPVWSEGAVVTLGDKVILDKPASAGCCNCVDVDYQMILEALCASYGIEIEES